MQKKLGSSFPGKPAERGRVWSHCNYQVVVEERNYQTQRLGNKMLRSAKHVTWLYSMTTDTIYEKRRLDWSHQVSAMGTTRWLQHDQTLLLCEGCGLWDYSLRWWCECIVTSHNTLASLFVGEKEGYIHLLNRIAIIQTWWRCRKVGRAWYIISQDHNKELLSTVKWFISSCQGMISQMDKICSELVKHIQV